MSEEEIEVSYKFAKWKENQEKHPDREADGENNPLLAWLEKKML